MRGRAAGGPRAKRRAVVAALVITGVAPAAGQDPAESALLELMSEAGIPGLAIAVVADGDVVWDAALGVTSTATDEAVTPETVFEAASLTKPVVAYATLRLVERGELDLDTPLWELLEYEPLAHDPRSHAITARHVLSHTTGLPHWARDRPLATSAAPGERWGYSGEGFVYLQRVLEQISGMTLQALLEREVFEPLGMEGSSVVWRPDYEERAATPHADDGTPVGKRKPEEANAAASLHTTAVDYGRFLAAIMQGRGLEPATAVSMLSPVAQVEQARGGREHAVHLQWSLGWGLQNGDLRNSIWHWGDNGTFRCYVIGYPSQGRGLVYFTNSENGLAIAEELVGRYHVDTHHALRWLDY